MKPKTDPTLKARLKRLNAELYHLTAKAYHDRPCPSVIWSSVKECGFDPTGLDRQWVPEADGSAMIDIGGAALTVTWHKMEVTGRFEIVAYAG